MIKSQYFKHLWTGKPKLNNTECTILLVLFFIPLIFIGLYFKWKDDD